MEGGRRAGDVRGDAGYVVLWDAAAVAAGLADLLAAPPVDLAALQAPEKATAPPAPTASAPAAVGDVDELANRMITRHLAAVAAAPEGTRNDTLHAAATALAGLSKAGRVDWASVRVSCGWRPRCRRLRPWPRLTPATGRRTRCRSRRSAPALAPNSPPRL